MTETLSIGWAASQAHRRRRIYRLVLGFELLARVGIGLACMFASDFVSDLFGLPPPVPRGWIVGWGATLILLTTLYIPGLQDPVRSRYPNVMGIVGRVWMAAVWFSVGGGLIWFGVFDLIFAVVLAVLYLRLGQAELMSRP